MNVSAEEEHGDSADRHSDPPRDLPNLLAGLEQAVTQQLDLTQADRLAAACDLTPLIDALLDAIGAHGHDALVPHAEPITRIRTLRQTLDLTLAQRKDEYSRSRAGMQQGKKLLRVYGQPTGAAPLRGSM